MFVRLLKPTPIRCNLSQIAASIYTIIFMINSSDDIRYCRDVFCCLPVADIVKRRTAKFLKKYKEANDVSNMYQILTVKLSYCY